MSRSLEPFYLGMVAALDVVAVFDDPVIMDEIAKTANEDKLGAAIEAEGLERTRAWWALRKLDERGPT